MTHRPSQCPNEQATLAVHETRSAPISPLEVVNKSQSSGHGLYSQPATAEPILTMHERIHRFDEAPLGSADIRPEREDMQTVDPGRNYLRPGPAQPEDMNGENVVSIDEPKKTFESFREQCIWLRCCFNTFRSLYESNDETSTALRLTAWRFFEDLNEILREYIILQICKLTDPAQDGRGRHTNLSVDGVNAVLCKNKLMTPEIRGYASELLRYREFVKESRNKIIGHLDRKTIVEGLPIGEHPAEEVFRFFDNLQKYTDAVGWVVGVGPLDYQAVPGKGDVLDLIKTLKRATSGGTSKGSRNSSARAGDQTRNQSVRMQCNEAR